MAPGSIAPALIACALSILVFLQYRENFKGIFSAKPATTLLMKRALEAARDPSVNLRAAVIQFERGHQRISVTVRGADVGCASVSPSRRMGTAANLREPEDRVWLQMVRLGNFFHRLAQFYRRDWAGTNPSSLLRIWVACDRRWSCWPATVEHHSRRRDRRFFCGLLNPFVHGGWVLLDLLGLLARCVRWLAHRSGNLGGIANRRLLTLEW